MNVMSKSDKVLAFERVFDAPREIVYAMWTHPRHLIRWYGPRGHSVTTCEVDFRIGGQWRFCMDKAGEETWVWGTYHDIQEPSKLVFSSSMHWHRYETLVTIHFDDLGDGRTNIRFRQEEFANFEDCDDHRWGWTSALDKFTEQLAVLHTAGLFTEGFWKSPRSSGVAEDFAEAARRAKEERERDPVAATPPRMR
jgi:uncharacterized protein YndB with AHSA1/START domain